MKLLKHYKVIAIQALAVLVIFSFITVSDNLFARSMDQSEVRPAVETWLRYVTADARPDAVITNMEPYKVDGKLIAYIANLADSGFCICGADDRLLPVYVYSPSGKYDPEDEMYQYFLDHMTEWIQKVEEAEKRNDPIMVELAMVNTDRANYWADLASGQITRSDRGLYEGPDDMALDMTSIWHQGSPYNYYCPSLSPGSDTHCVTGCVANSMAGIMRYWEWPETGVGNDSTVYNYQWTSDTIEEPVADDPLIPADWEGGNRLEWSGGNLRMNGYWDNSLYGHAKGIRKNWVYAGTMNGDAYRTADSGDHWGKINQGLIPYTILALVVNSEGTVYAGTWGGGVSSNWRHCGEWTPMNTGLTNTNVNALALNSYNIVYAGTESGGVYRYGGGTWTQYISGLTNTNVRALAVNSSNAVFAGTNGGGVYRSEDYGTSWTQKKTGLTDLYVRALAINSSDHIFAGTESGGVFRSTDDGDNWTQINTGLTDTYVRTLAVNSSDHIFAGTDGGGVHRSTDNGDNWTPINSGLAEPSVRTIAVNMHDDLFAGTMGGVYRSVNNGSNWTQVNTGIDDANKSVRALVTDYTGYLAALQALYLRLTPVSQKYYADFGDMPYQWDEIEDEHTDPPEVDDYAVAMLCYEAGISVHMGYGLKGSGAGSLTEPFVNHFRYDSDIEGVVGDTGNYGSGFDGIMDDIQWLRPVQYHVGWPDYHSWIIFGYDRTDLPDSVVWRMNSGNGHIDFCIFNPIYSDHCFNRKIAPLSVVRFVGSTSSGDGTPSDPYRNIEAAVSDCPDYTTLILKAGSDNTISTPPYVISKKCLLKGYQSVIRKE